MTAPTLTTRILNATVLVTALGYFVDLYDYYIFLVSRVATLADFGITGDAVTTTGLHLVNLQFAGLLTGGLFFGILGDKLGRKQSLLGSILLYSLATLWAGLTHDFDTFSVLRFIAGFGIAGEVGVGVTLISETMHKDRRALGVTVFASVGLTGVVAAALATQFFDWRTCYVAGACAGLLLLATRMLVMEPEMYRHARATTARRGDLRLIFSDWVNIKLYVLCALVAMPVFFGVSIVMTFSPELGAGLGILEPVRASTTMIVGYAATVVGEIIVGLLSQRWRSRKRVMFAAMAFMAATVIIAFNCLSFTSPTAYYVFAGFIGFFMGYWCNYVALSAEQFGTNLRATAATSIPNMARGTTILINTGFAALKPHGVVLAAGSVGMAVLLIAATALYFLPETFGKDLDYTE